MFTSPCSGWTGYHRSNEANTGIPFKYHFDGFFIKSD